ncbi:MAG: hypothetical protein U0Q18_21470 [Bryobacteraceae bacterium]
MKRSEDLLRELAERIGLVMRLARAIPTAVSEARENDADPIDPATRFEPNDVHYTAVILTGAGLLVSLWIIVMLIYPYFSFLEHTRAESSPPPTAAARHGNPLPPVPRIQQNPRRDLEDLQKEEDGALTRYSWVDRAHGVVAIPIEQAIKVLGKRGIPAQAGAGNETYFDPREGTRLTGFEGKVEPEPR